ncbi:tyrosine-type recombinase/integrase [Nocardiopsis sp. RSe5-2]|uniref:Tyrosine-type recombinase/integrase n=1 Tax=Nocardiopsis endophytica TaxID=3018445 RepID=A0ABT4U977_9ACTN|nr:tyrosine-type recombinase/integrase [Nocardiopsis endophytica]MDA2813019.1 tyrosine-type recombinase/integrase [Nocardiopsis endophytica]
MSAGAQDIQFWEIRKRANRRKPWELRWRIDTVEKSRSFLTKELATTHKTDLHRAARNGERFSTVTGEPESWAASRESVWSLLRSYVRHAWAHTTSGNTRSLVASHAVHLAMASVDDARAKRHKAPAPAARVRKALNAALAFRVHSGAARPEDRILPPDEGAFSELDRACLAWVERVSLPVSQMGDKTAATKVLERCSMRVDGRGPLTASSVRRRRGVWSLALDHAAEHKMIASNPISGARFSRSRAADAVNPRTVPSYEQASRLVRALLDTGRARDDFLAGFFGLAYLAGTRPSETRAVREQDIIWPEQVTDPDAVPGFGVLMVSGARTEVPARYTDSGQHGEARELKHREVDEVRPVPLNPEAVALLRRHLARHGTAPDGRLWWQTSAPHGEYAVLSGAVYRRAWERARKTALTPSELSLGLAVRPYDLRHGCASWLLYAKVPAPEVARRLGHTMDVLMRTYAHWFDTGVHTANGQVKTALDKAGPFTGQTGPDNGETDR